MHGPVRRCGSVPYSDPDPVRPSAHGAKSNRGADCPQRHGGGLVICRAEVQGREADDRAARSNWQSSYASITRPRPRSRWPRVHPGAVAAACSQLSSVRRPTPAKTTGLSGSAQSCGRARRPSSRRPAYRCHPAAGHGRRFPHRDGADGLVLGGAHAEASTCRGRVTPRRRRRDGANPVGTLMDGSNAIQRTARLATTRKAIPAVTVSPLSDYGGKKSAPGPHRTCDLPL